MNRFWKNIGHNLFMKLILTAFIIATCVAETLAVLGITIIPALMCVFIMFLAILCLVWLFFPDDEKK